MNKLIQPKYLTGLKSSVLVGTFGSTAGAVINKTMLTVQRV